MKIQYLKPRALRRLSSATVLACVLSLSHSAQADAIVQTSFEADGTSPWSNGIVLDGAVAAGWIGSGVSSSGESQGVSRITASEAHTGTQSLYLLDDDDSGYAAVASYYPGVTMSSATLRYWFMQGISSDTTFRVDFRTGSAIHARLIIGYNTYNGITGFSLVSDDGSLASIAFTDPLLSGLELTDWNSLSVTFIDQEAFFLEVNGTKILDVTPDSLADVNLSVDNISFAAGYGAGFNTEGWIDDVQLDSPVSISEFSAGVLPAVASLMMLVIGLRRHCSE